MEDELDNMSVEQIMAEITDEDIDQLFADVTDKNIPPLLDYIQIHKESCALIRKVLSEGTMEVLEQAIPNLLSIKEMAQQRINRNETGEDYKLLIKDIEDFFDRYEKHKDPRGRFEKLIVNKNG